MGEVTIWEPPSRLVYLCTCGATGRTRPRSRSGSSTGTGWGRGVEIEHRGWEALGAGAVDWRDRNHGGWATLLPHYVAAAEVRAAPGRPSPRP